MIKSIMRRAIHFLGINFLARQIYPNYPRIIMFHKICPSTQKDFSCLNVDDFRQYLKYIKKYYYPMKVCDLVNSRNEQGFYPRNAVAITFDDGFKSFYDFAWPVLQEFEIPATIFVVPDLVEQQSWIWPDQLSYIYDNGLNSFTDKTKNQLTAELKKMPSEKRDMFISDSIKRSGMAMPNNIPENFQLMTWKLLKELSESSLVEIGSHTLTHPILSTENSQNSWEEISTSRRVLERKIGRPVKSFCYPNGQIGDYRSDQMEMIRKAGYSCGIASHFGYVTPDSNLMALPRIGAEHSDIYSFYKYLDGVEYFLRKKSDTNCELCLQKDFENRITKEYCSKKQCFK